MPDQPTQYPGLFRSEKFAPREQFSISQIEKAFGAGYECLTESAADQGLSNGSGTGCLRAWGWRYLGGIKQPEYTWEEACALPEHTEPLRRLKGGAKAKTWGKVAEREIERFLRNDPSLQTQPINPHILVGLHLLPHPRDMVSFGLQEPVRVRTNPDGLPRVFGGLADPVTWQGFKDFLPVLWVPVTGTNGYVEQRQTRYLIDFKTTKPIVNKRDNITAGRAPNAWAYMKDPDKLRLDWQYNLYEWDELVQHGSLVPARWVYFASPGTEQYPNKPEARASDMPTPDLEIVRSVVLALDRRARELREYIRAYRAGDLTVIDLTANVLSCSAYGGCPYRASVGGPCDAEQTQIVPVGRIVPRTRARSGWTPSWEKTTPAPVTPMGPGFTFEPTLIGAPHMSAPLSIMDQIKAQIAAGAAPAQNPAPGAFTPGAPPAAAQAHAPGYPHSAGAHVGAPVPTAGLPPVFAAPVPTVNGGPFNPAAFSFGPPAAAPAPAAPPPGPPAFGSQSATEGWLCDGQGGYFRIADIPFMLAAGHPNAVRLWGTPAPATAAPSPTPGLPPEAFAPGGPVGAPAPSVPPTGSPAPAQPTAEKRKRRTKAEMAQDAQASAAGAQTEGFMFAGDLPPAGDMPRDTDRAPALDVGERIAAALENIAQLLGRLAGLSDG